VKNTHFIRTTEDRYVEIEAGLLPDSLIHQLQHKLTKNIYKKASGFKSDKIEVLALSYDFAKSEVERIGKRDLKNLIGMAVVCWLYTLYFMKSFLLSTLSLVNMCMSVPITLVLYRLVFR
jgi:hypothetical protein